MRRDAIHFSMFLSSSATFFQLRKLHEWKPQRRHDHTGVLLSRQETTDKWQSNVDEDISLVNASHFMFSDLELPPELAIASLSPTKLTNDITSTAHLALLRRFQKTRDQKMIRMLRSAINKLIGVVKGLIGRFKNLVEFAMNKKTIEVCTVVDRHLCANNDGFKEATFLVLEFIVAAHLGVYMSREGRPSVRLQDIQEDFIQFISEVSWFRYRPRGVHLFKRKPRWSLDELAAYLFPYGNNKRKDVPFSPEEMDLLRKAGKLLLLCKMYPYLLCDRYFAGEGFVLTVAFIIHAKQQGHKYDVPGFLVFSHKQSRKSQSVLRKESGSQNWRIICVFPRSCF